MFHKRQLWLLLLPFALFIGCSSDEENPVKPTEKSDPPEFNLREITFPEKMQNSTDEKAQLAITLIKDAMSFEGTGCVFKAPDGAQALKESKIAWEYSWVEGTLTKRLAITLLSEIQQRKWQIYYTGEAEGITYEDNWRFMDASQQTDMTVGHIYVYKANTKQIVQEWTWRTDGQEYTFERIQYDDPKLKLEIVIKADKSGRLERFVKPSATASFMHDLLIYWESSGVGTWWTYENGVNSGTGTWN